jgi:hypothetical protein
MNPQDNNNTGLGMPQGANSMGALPPIQGPATYPAPNFNPPAPQFSTGNISQPAPPAPPQTQAAPTPAPVTPTNLPVSSTPPANPSQPKDAGPIDDGDTAFDEEWVAKAKAVVAHTHADPYLQSQELSKLKAQYIKLRYNKDIKVSE